MTVPLASRTQVQILADDLSTPAVECDLLPPDVAPRLTFSDAQIQRGLSSKKPFGLTFCLICIAKGSGRAGRCPMREAESDAVSAQTSSHDPTQNETT